MNNSQPLIQPVPPPLEPQRPHRSVTLTSIIGHTLIQLISLGLVGGAWYLERIDSLAALLAIGAIGGFSGLQAVRGKPPTSLLVATAEAARYAFDRHLS